MNTITVVGRVGRKEELQTITFANGSFSKIKFTVADNQFEKGEKKTTWFHVELTGKSAENFEKIVSIGDTVALLGVMSSYTIEADQKTFWTVRAKEFNIISSKKKDDGASYEQTPNNIPKDVYKQSDIDLDSIPF